MTSRKRNLSILLGGVLIIAGAAYGYLWFYYIAPLRKLSDTSWRRHHSEVELWAEEQTLYRHLGESPDLCFRGDRIGYYGDEKWFFWLAERVANPEKFRVCGCTDYALALMANTQPPVSWTEWAKTNRARTQEEWLANGFREHGLEVRTPAAPDDVEPLLRLLGRKGWNVLYRGRQGTNEPGAVPSHVQYNAFRWLRDSGFRPQTFARSNSVALADMEVARGIANYAEWVSAFPEQNRLGLLNFSQSLKRPTAGALKPLRPGIKFLADSLVFGPIVLGVGLIWWAIRRSTLGEGCYLWPLPS